MAKREFICPKCGGGFRDLASLEGESAPCPLCKYPVKKWPPPEAEEPDGAGPAKRRRGRDISPEPAGVGWMVVVGWLMIVLGIGNAALHGGRYFDPPEPPPPNAAERHWEEWRDERSKSLVRLIVAILIAAGGGGLLAAHSTASLSNAVKALAPLPGRSLREIERRLGAPKVREELPSGEVHATWVSPGYRVTLAFRDGQCVRVAREDVGAE